MKSFIATALAIIGIASASAIPAPPAPSPSIVRVLPPSWSWKISSLKGPGCPDIAAPTSTPYRSNTRTTFGMNTMDGSEIYYWHIAYPALRADLESNDSTWCETEVEYQEYKDINSKEKGDGYRLRMHKNGTRTIATYDLEKGVKANWEFTYDVGKGKKIMDEIEVVGPYSSSKVQVDLNSPVSGKSELYKMPQCGAGKIKFRIDLSIEGKEGKKGVVASEKLNESEAIAKDQYYGTQVGWSYDWEKCFTSDV